MLGSESLVYQNEQAGIQHSSQVGSSKLTSSHKNSSSNMAGSKTGEGPNLSTKLIAAALANAFASLPYLLSCYDPQQLSAGTAGSVAVTNGDGSVGVGDEGSPGILASLANSIHGSTTNPSTSNSSTSVSSYDTSSGLQGMNSHDTPSAPATMKRPVYAGSGVEDKSGGSPQGLGRALDKGLDRERRAAAAARSRKDQAEAIATLLPPSVVGPILSVLSRRLPQLHSRHLCSVASTLVELRLYPGRSFLMAHVSMNHKSVVGQI